MTTIGICFNLPDSYDADGYKKLLFENYAEITDVESVSRSYEDKKFGVDYGRIRLTCFLHNNRFKVQVYDCFNGLASNSFIVEDDSGPYAFTGLLCGVIDDSQRLIIDIDIVSSVIEFSRNIEKKLPKRVRDW